MPGSSRAQLVIVGVTKAGTTSLFNYLAHHPDICGERFKEFESLTPLVKGEGRERLDLEQAFAVQFGHCPTARYNLEASPSYFAGGPEVVTAVKDLLPEAHVIVSLRDPVDRLWSAYQMKRRRDQVQPGSFDDFVERAVAVADGAPGDGELHQTVRTGRYADFLPLWSETFGSRLRIAWFEQWTAAPVAHVEDLYRWLDLPSARGLADAVRIRHNPGELQRSALVQRSALWLHRRTSVVTLRHPVAKRRLVNLYRQLNTRPFDEELTDERRRALGSLFEESNGRLARHVDELGISRPEWLNPVLGTSVSAGP